MKRFFLILCISLIWISSDARKLPGFARKNVNFIVLTDSGSHVDSLRGKEMLLADVIDGIVKSNDIDFVVHAGDPIHQSGVKSKNDPQWKYKLLDIFQGENLKKIPWHCIPGNHEYRGNPQAVADYSEVQPWWDTPSRYYSMNFGYGKGGKEDVLLLFLDTTPLLDSYNKTCKGKVDKGYRSRELHWADSTLAASNSKWKIAVGHHPIYAHSKKNEAERADLQSRLLPILEKGGTVLYLNGHIHNFQHIKRSDSDIHFVTNASPVLTRKAKKVEGTQYCDRGPGFTAVSVSKKYIRVCYLDENGDIEYEFKIK
ncbi:MAG: metallophosphoesterase [Bacteroidales bacterium]|nr:metallophosphoesterase [Bacteroidales bacterium]